MAVRKQNIPIAAFFCRLCDFLETEVYVWDRQAGPVAEAIRHAFLEVCGVGVAVTGYFGGEGFVVVN